MKTLTNKITLPDGRVVVMSARYESNLQEVLPIYDGPWEDLRRMVGPKYFDGTVTGIVFDGWLERLLGALGCRTEFSSSGDWIEMEM